MLERFNFSVDPMNIGFQSLENYKVSLLIKTEDLINRMRWKLHFARQKLRNKKKANKENMENLEDLSTDAYDKNEFYGLRSTKIAPPDIQLKPFEEDIFGMIGDLRVKKYSN